MAARLHSDGAPLLTRSLDRLTLAWPTASPLGRTELDVTTDVRRTHGHIVATLRNGGDHVRAQRTEQVEMLPDGSLSVSVTTCLDPQSAAAGRPLAAGVWDVSIRVDGLG